MADNETRIALVTGASRGIGAAVAIELARRGVHPVLVARRQGGLEATDDAIRAAGGQATLLPLDLADGALVDQLGPSLHARFGRLDILVANAGVLGTLTPVAHILDKTWTEAMAVNVAATWRVIRTCAPLLTRAPAGRAVFVTSSIVAHPRAYWGLYGATKAAADHLVRSWAEEVRQTTLRVNLYNPGRTATRMRAAAMPGEDPATLPTPAQVAVPLADLCEPTEVPHAALIEFAP